MTFITFIEDKLHIDGLGQERRDSIANTLELHLSWTNSSIYSTFSFHFLLIMSTYFRRS